MISEVVLKKWQDLQSTYAYPVDSFGQEIKLDEKDKFKVWEDLGLYAYMKK